MREDGWREKYEKLKTFPAKARRAQKIITTKPHEEKIGYRLQKSKFHHRGHGVHGEKLKILTTNVTNYANNFHLSRKQ
jgi:hypothetical protein